MIYLIAKLNCNQMLQYPQTIIINLFAYSHYLPCHVIFITIQGRKNVKKPSNGRNIFRYESRPISFEQIPVHLTRDGFAGHPRQLQMVSVDISIRIKPTLLDKPLNQIVGEYIWWRADQPHVCSIVYPNLWSQY